MVKNEAIAEITASRKESAERMRRLQSRRLLRRMLVCSALGVAGGLFPCLSPLIGKWAMWAGLALSSAAWLTVALTHIDHSDRPVSERGRMRKYSWEGDNSEKSQNNKER